MTDAEEIMEKAVMIVTAIRKDQGGIGHDFVPKMFIEKSIPCPVCKEGTMTYTISNYNGHRSAQCSTNCFGQYVE